MPTNTNTSNQYYQTNYGQYQMQAMRNDWMNQVEQNLAQMFPGGELMDMAYNNDGMPYMAHMMDQYGNVKTIMIDVNLNLTFMINGYC